MCLMQSSRCLHFKQIRSHGRWARSRFTSYILPVLLHLIAPFYRLPLVSFSISHFMECYYLLWSRPSKNCQKKVVNRWKVFSRITHRKSPFSRHSSRLSSRDGMQIMCLIGVTSLHSHGDSHGEIPGKDVFIMEKIDTHKEREIIL